MRKHSLPTPERLRKLLRYEPDTGRLFWRKRDSVVFPQGKRSREHSCAAWNAKNAGREAFTSINLYGYRVGRVDDKQFRAHRVIWAIYWGKWPVRDIDHLNGDPSDNRIENLKDVTKSENMRNTNLKKNNTSGYNGVDSYGAQGKWRARGNFQGRMKHIGCFDSPDDAAVARREFNRKNAYSERHGTQPAQIEGTAVRDEEFDLDG